jgi:hypothetical protein
LASSRRLDMLRRLLLVLLLTAFLTGCGGDRDRNINRDADRPRSGDTPKDKPADKPKDKPADKAKKDKGAT